MPHVRTFENFVISNTVVLGARRVCPTRDDGRLGRSPNAWVRRAKPRRTHQIRRSRIPSTTVLLITKFSKVLTWGIFESVAYAQ